MNGINEISKWCKNSAAAIRENKYFTKEQKKKFHIKIGTF